MDKLRHLCEHLKQLKEAKFTGYVRINYSQGGIAKVEQHEEILKKGTLKISISKQEALALETED